MRRAHENVSNERESNLLPSYCSPAIAEEAFRLLEGRWKLAIMFHLFDRETMRFSELERAIADISQRMLSQQLRALERDGIVLRTIYAEVPPKVEYRLTPFGASARFALHSILTWAAGRAETLRTAESTH